MYAVAAGCRTPCDPGLRRAHIRAMKDMPADRGRHRRRSRATTTGVNWVGLKTLYLREVRRFWKVGMQTLAAPVVTTLLYMLVFVVAMSGARPPVARRAPSATFVAPGLIMMPILNNAFANSSSSLLQAKMNGLIGDFLTPPLSPLEQAVGLRARRRDARASWSALVTAVAVLAVRPAADRPPLGGRSTSASARR